MKIIDSPFGGRTGLTEAALPPRSALFFDIETTGFSPKNASVYLIGCAYRTEDGWQLLQFFAQTPAEEREILRAFLDLAASYSLFVHFNGQTFDVPFLAAKCRKHALPAFSPSDQCDLYKLISPYKNLLRLPGCRQKQLEAFLGIQRKDPFHGGELIALYKSYCEKPEEALEQALLLHNREDLSGLTALWSLLSYPALLEQGSFTVESAACEEDTSHLCLPLSLPFPLPQPLSWHSAGEPTVYLAARDDRAILKLPVLEGELKYFYPDPKNYSYLPEEDQAIHKSVAIYVDKSRRMPATADNCYTRKRGRFLPLPTPDTLPGLPRFRAARGAPEWILADDAFCADPERLSAYAQGILKTVCPAGRRTRTKPMPAKP